MDEQKNFPKNTRIPNFLKIRAVEAELFRADRQTDMMKLRVASRNLGTPPPPKKIKFLLS
jgi:hypothetical protein